MPRRNGHVPAYRLHKPSGQARVIINREHIYLGPYGSPESREKYARFIAETSIQQDISGLPPVPQPASPEPTSNGFTVGELIVAFWQYAEGYYTKDGTPTKELQCFRDSLRPLRDLYATTPASEFGPKSLQAVRGHMIQQGLCRKLINQRIGRVKRVFKWAVAEELVAPSVFHGLQAVAGLRFGRTEARESEPVKPVDDTHVEAVLPFLTPHVVAMIRLQRLTGMRPSDVTKMRPCDIDRSGEIWIYEPFDHKNRWRGHRRIIAIGPKAQAILQPFLSRDPQAFLFSPKESEAWRRENRPAYSGRKRKTPVYPSELRAREKAKLARRGRQSKRPKGDRYDTASYGKAINHGFRRAEKANVKIPHWHPNQLRHTRGTEIRRQHGVEAAQVVLGHARADVTQVYAERNVQKAIEIARESG
jgi:integrase